MTPGSASAPLVLLASRSPRRRELLDAAGVAYIARHPGIDDSMLQAGVAPPEHYAAGLAYLKADAAIRHNVFAAQEIARAAWVLGADTAVVKGSLLIGTPRDEADAERIIRLLSDGVHDVVTGVALVRPVAASAHLGASSGETAPARRVLLVDRARVQVGALSETQIREYLASGLWQGKAGAYNLAERLMAGWPIEYQGDPGTIMGLPTRKLVPLLSRLG